LAGGAVAAHATIQPLALRALPLRLPEPRHDPRPQLGLRRLAASHRSLLLRSRRRDVFLLPALPARLARAHHLVLLRHQGLASLDLVPHLGVAAVLFVATYVVVAVG